MAGKLKKTTQNVRKKAKTAWERRPISPTRKRILLSRVKLDHLVRADNLAMMEKEGDVQARVNSAPVRRGQQFALLSPDYPFVHRMRDGSFRIVHAGTGKVLKKISRKKYDWMIEDRKKRHAARKAVPATP